MPPSSAVSLEWNLHELYGICAGLCVLTNFLPQFELVMNSITLLMAKSLSPLLTLLGLWILWPPTPVP